MPPKEIANLSSSAVVDLKAELFKTREAFERARQSHTKPDESVVVSGSETIREFKKLSDANKLRTKELQDARLRRPNRHGGNQNLAQKREKEPETVGDAALEASWVALQRKAKEYERLKRGAEDGEEPEKRAKGEDKLPLVDFVRKHLDKEDADAEDGALGGIAEAEEDEDPWIEATDSFGRTRILRRSQAEKLKQTGPAYVVAGFASASEASSDQNYTPELLSEDMRRELARQEWEQQAMAEIKDPLPPPKHYDPQREIRNLGVGFYGFSQDDDERKRQMDALNALRKDTFGSREKVEQVKNSRKAKLDERKALLKERKRRKEGLASSNSVSNLYQHQEESDVDEAARDGVQGEDDVDSFLKGL
ncbi:hypothetical protein BC830DRAFT_730664 [Chytriomyces sp. MP71]|nr:hypothetical protein BC830DRAFT_730664 [Chytriomyces sp. MP71]